MSLKNPRYFSPRRPYGLKRRVSKFPRKIRYRVDVSYSAIQRVLKERGWQMVEGESDNWDLYWCELHNLQLVLDKPLGPNQIVPHFRNYYEISKKSLLARNIGRYKRSLLKQGKEQEAKLCDCIPTTFELPNDYILLSDYYRRNPGRIYIVKPASGSKGSRIFLFKKIKDLNDWKMTRDWTGSTQSGAPSDYQNNSVLVLEDRERETPEEWIVQVYITNPYLVGGRKFDIRIFVLVTSFLPMIVWIARDGFARFCGKPFNLDDLSDLYGHLTNCSIQLAKAAEIRGFKWPIGRVRQYLTAKHGAQAVETLLQDIANIIITSLKSVSKTISHNKHCIEMYGYDVIIDTDLRPWLLEVNSSPSLDATDDEDRVMKYNLITDLLNVIDFEGRTSGNEIRIGGFDLVWKDGPIYRPCPGESEIGPIITGSRNLNLNLGDFIFVYVPSPSNLQRKQCEVLFHLFW
ncbi:probable tubulin polyglutamylase TTLL9 isoform X3 [Rhodnius prolixus]|uniref:probable tubulin polyglutamylase TTLL9 isoform X3 n=1 Tax=Rhodnius prolixus TaxID=13249 RepID=UPI003D18CB12